MANKIATLKDKAGNTLYPVTLGSCVYGEDNLPLPEKANKDLSNTSYPEIIHDASDNTFDGIAHFGAGDRVIESYISSNGSTWYRIWASGWKECGLRYGGTLNGVYLTLPVVFKAPDKFKVQMSFLYSYDAYGRGTWTTEGSSDTVSKVRIWSYANNEICLYCCGY